MQDFIVVCIIIVLAGLAVIPAFKHFQGKGGCCGGGGYRPRKKKLSRVVGKKTFQVEGMHCEHCKNRVTEAVNRIPGVSAKVHLKKGVVTVSYEKMIDDEELRQAIEKAGYIVRGINGQISACE